MTNPPPAPPNPVHILLVEDDDIDAEAIRRAFARQRISNPITRVRDGVEALEMLQAADPGQRVPRPYLILLDINMPRMNGHELLEALRDDPQLCTSIVFVLTTSDSDADKMAAYERQIAGYLLKSRAGKDFLNLIEMLHAYWRVVEFPPSEA